MNWSQLKTRSEVFSALVNLHREQIHSQAESEGWRTSDDDLDREIDEIVSAYEQASSIDREVPQ